MRGLKLAFNLTFLFVYVAPYVGAWIETIGAIGSAIGGVSHPTWVRGLKHRGRIAD